MKLNRHRWQTRRVERSVIRCVMRPTYRPAYRCVTRRAVRTVIPYDGPDLNDICRLLEAYLRLAKAHDEKNKPKRPRKPRFTTLCTPEESRRQFEADLERAYGPAAQAAKAAEAQNASKLPLAQRPPPALPRLATPNPNLNLNPDRPASAKDVPSPGPPSQPPAERPKCDVVGVPLVRNEYGMWTCDWSKARPVELIQHAAVVRSKT
jgi:hypothetical protein